MKKENVWEKAAQNFIWDIPYKKISKSSDKIGPKKWFIGGKINYSKTIFEKNLAAGNAEKEAVVFYKSPFQRESYSYALLLDEVSSLAYYLRKKGIDKKSRVLILTDSKKEQVFLILALLRLGVQFGVLYHKFPPEMINSLIHKSGATHIISNKKLIDSLNFGKAIFVKSKNELKKKNTLISPRIIPESLASFLCFSSGTTGKNPKIFLNGNAGFFIGADYILRTNFFSKLKKYFILNTLDFAFGVYPLMCSLMTPLIQGGKIIFFDFKYRLNDKSTVDILEKEDIEMIISSPPFFEVPINKYKSHKIKNIILGGQKVSLNVLESVKKIFPKAKIFNVVGSQETFAYMSSFSKKDSETINIMKPLPWLDYKIIGQEIFIKNTWPCLARPLNDRKLFLKRWRGNFFRTGDLVKRTRLGLEIIGRENKIIKHRGRQINLEYLESFIESQPLVKKAKCLIFQNKTKSEIIVFLIAKQNGKKQLLLKSRADIKKNIEAKFGSYAKPEKIIFMKKFPTSSSGKVMEKILLKKYAK